MNGCFLSAEKFTLYLAITIGLRDGNCKFPKTSTTACLNYPEGDFESSVQVLTPLQEARSLLEAHPGNPDPWLISGDASSQIRIIEADHCTKTCHAKEAKIRPLVIVS